MEASILVVERDGSGLRVFASGTRNPYCNVVPPFLTQFKGLASYAIPRAGIQVSGTMQSIPSANLAANFSVPTAVAALCPTL